MKRNLLDYITLIFKGMAMGAADLVPGVSGGTIAFISGVYEELISSLNAINFSLIKTLRTEGLKSTWKKINGNFLIAIFAGIAISVVSLSKLVWVVLQKNKNTVVTIVHWQILQHARRKNKRQTL